MVPEYVSQHIKPDYNKSIQQVFSDFARALIIGFGHFNFVLPDLSDTGLQIPSWVPDLTNEWDSNLWGTDCKASGDSKPQFRVENDLQLVAYGFEVDVIDGTAPQLGWGTGGLEVWTPATQPSAPTAAIQVDVKVAIVRTLHRDSSWDCNSGTTVLDIPWIDSLDASNPRIQLMKTRGWGPVLQHANLVDPTLLLKRLDENFRPWGRQLRSFFIDDDEAIPECHNPDGFIASLDKHVGIVYPIITTAAGRFGTTIRPVKAGDRVFVIEGCDGLVVLRPVAEVGTYQVISQCYVEGLMKGEGMEKLKKGEVTLTDVTMV